jgi:hypothetical protein
MGSITHRGSPDMKRTIEFNREGLTLVGDLLTPEASMRTAATRR